MGQPQVVVLRERPTLASSIAELLEVEGIPVGLASSIEAAAEVAAEAQRPPAVVVSTTTGYPADLVRAWRAGPLHECDLIVVGNRDPELRSHGKLHVARVPLVPDDFLQLVRTLIRDANPVPRQGSCVS